MKIQKIVLTSIALVLIVCCLNAIIIEGGSFIKNGRPSAIKWIMSRHEKTESELNENLAARKFFFECKGLFNRIADKRYVYGIYKLENGYLTSVSTETKIDDKLRNLEEFHDWCADHNIPLLYVNLPSKAENIFLEDYGVKSFAGENADNFLAALSADGIDHMDMRDFFPAADLESLDIFFRTDHHWKISAGLFTAQVISQYINDHYHLGLNTAAVADEKMHTEYMPQSWTGESGLRTSILFSGKDDFEYITPVDPGNFHLTIPNRHINKSGGFPIMIKKSVFQSTDPYGDSYYYAYLFGNDPIQIIDNLDERSGRILMVKDSYGQAVNPFLAMTADELICWDVRYNKTDLREYLTEHPVDLVVIMYTESFIQSRMFNFWGAK